MVCLDNLVDHHMNLVVSEPNSPSEIADSIIDTLKPRMTLRLESIPAKGARSRCAATGAHEDRVCGMPEMMYASKLSRLGSFRVRAWRSWKA
jgi:hypothetical protein